MRSKTIIDVSAVWHGDSILQPDPNTCFADNKIAIEHDVHPLSYLKENTVITVPTLTYVHHPEHEHLVIEHLKEITFNDTATTFLDVPNNYSTIMLKDTVAHNNGDNVFACGSPGHNPQVFILDDYIDIGINNIVCMEGMDSCVPFSGTLDYIAQWCGGSFGDDGGGSICVMKRNLLADDVHSGEADHKFGEGVGDRFNKCVAYFVEKICIWDISALKWGKVLLQIFPDPRGLMFLERTCLYVCWYGYGCTCTW